MSLPVWPMTVEHKPLRSAFRLVEADVAPNETELEGGASRRRPRTTVRRRLFAIGWDWSDTEFAAFETFYRLTLGKGSLRFEMSFFDGGAYAVRVCQFKGMYEAHRPATFWRVTAQLWVFGGV